MSSPFAASVFQQYDLEFKVSSGVLVPNEVGDLEPVASTPVTVRMFLKALNFRDTLRVREVLGVDNAEVALGGYCTVPSILPSNISGGAVAKLDLNGVQGIFTLETTAKPAITVLEKALGTKVTGGWRKGAL